MIWIYLQLSRVQYPFFFKKKNSCSICTKMGNWSVMFITCKDEIIFSIVSFLVAKVRFFFLFYLKF